MNAKEMFEKLGYVHSGLAFMGNEVEIWINQRLDRQFRFYDNKQLAIWHEDNVVRLTEKEFETIVKYARELGWLE